jgi:hypothetical protein
MPPENQRITELMAEIESMALKRRQAEQDLFQLEADTTVRNSEIKNLEVYFLIRIYNTCDSLFFD